VDYTVCLLANEPGISLIILTLMKILKRNLNRSTFVVWEIKRNVSVVRFKFCCNILISGKIIKEMPGSVASGTHCTCNWTYNLLKLNEIRIPTGRWRKIWRDQHPWGQNKPGMVFSLLLLLLMTVKMTIKMKIVMTVACAEHITGWVMNLD